MEHGKVEISYDPKEKSRLIIYTSVSGESYKGTINLPERNHSFSVEGIGTRHGDTYTVQNPTTHCCGASGYGQSLDDKCDGCEETKKRQAILRDIEFLIEGDED